MFHVRSVTQGDVIRADAKDIPRIFQLLYAGEGEARRPQDALEQPQDAPDHHGNQSPIAYNTWYYRGSAGWMIERFDLPCLLIQRNDELQEFWSS